MRLHTEAAVWLAVGLTRWLRSTKPGPVNTWMGDCVGKYTISVCGQLPGQHPQPSMPPSAVGKSSTRLRAGVKAGRVHLCRLAR